MHDQHKPKGPRIAPIESVLLPDFCKPEYLAQYLGIPLNSVVAAIESGEIPAGKVDGHLVIDREAFAAALARHRGAHDPAQKSGAR